MKVPNNSSPNIISMPIRILRRVPSVGKNALALIGAGAVAYMSYEYNEANEVEKAGTGKKRKVLVLPFHRMELVETKEIKFNTSKLASSLSSDNEPIQVEVRELVDVIHAAAQDPNIVVLYGTFGQGSGFRAGGLAHIEEIGNALKVWRESHRVHLTPNLTYDKTIVRSSNGSPKPSYAFADSFMASVEKGNLEYNLACAFSHIHMQKNGDLQLFGAFSSNYFFRSFLDRYGIKAHFFKQGKYKNAPNTFTESDYTREHGMSVRNLVDQIDAYERDSIVNGRGAKGFDSMVWKMIRKHGTFTGGEAVKLGLLDHLPKVDPLDNLLESNKDDETKSTMKKKMGNETDVAAFHADEEISFEDYRAVLVKRKRSQLRSQLRKHQQNSFLKTYPAFDYLLSCLGYQEKLIQMKQQEEEEKIAVIDIIGSIDAALAQKTIASLRKIKKDPKVKAVVLRIDSPGGDVISSESILQECKDTPQPIICSMSNVCASGGYYIATGCDRIFALPTTITGSIGVFGVKLDLTRLARKYGINVQSISTGPHSAMYNTFQPMNELVKNNVAQNINRNYEHFKLLVAEGRGLNIRDVEPLAQGKIWTGREAKGNGLVDELAGLDRAIEYARRTYTKGEGEVERWPKKESFFQKLSKVRKMIKGDSTLEKFVTLCGVLPHLLQYPETPIAPNENVTTESLIKSITSNPGSVHALQKGGVFLTIDESSALSHLLMENANKTHPLSLVNSSLWRSET